MSALARVLFTGRFHRHHTTHCGVRCNTLTLNISLFLLESAHGHCPPLVRHPRLGQGVPLRGFVHCHAACGARHEGRRTAKPQVDRCSWDASHSAATRAVRVIVTLYHTASRDKVTLRGHGLAVCRSCTLATRAAPRGAAVESMSCKWGSLLTRTRPHPSPRQSGHAP